MAPDKWLQAAASIRITAEHPLWTNDKYITQKRKHAPPIEPQCGHTSSVPHRQKQELCPAKTERYERKKDKNGI